ncbi:hypothetical protein NAT51_18490 [Flavobacterium amniphilum]|uniref:hypothetical protein n=1 Tax=Flavobacterium amniphilum TaxID=1834035 RepID=UPI002029B840|nr:hypothetical protein [Flavobacterium amniphilum]MCL9807521.1 hypothetical protein [Flavobacterium amniphilum]
MIKTKKYSNTIAFWSAVIAIDIFIYLVLGISQMDYDDSYQGPEEEYGSLASMNPRQLTFYFLLQFWNILNIAGLIILTWKVFKYQKQKNSIQ